MTATKSDPKVKPDEAKEKPPHADAEHPRLQPRWKPAPEKDDDDELFNDMPV